MLVVFAISITPVIVFHDAFADHTDSIANSTSSSKERVGKKLFNCQCDHIVAESPFTGTEVIHIQPAKQSFVITNAGNPVGLISAIKISRCLRGPPVV